LIETSIYQVMNIWWWILAGTRIIIIL